MLYKPILGTKLSAKRKTWPSKESIQPVCWKFQCFPENMREVTSAVGLFRDNLYGKLKFYWKGSMVSG